jgi:hypothetical protein
MEPQFREPPLFREPPHWLDRHIAEQAKHYGMSVRQKAKLFDGAAEYVELIEYGIVEEPENRNF